MKCSQQWNNFIHFTLLEQKRISTIFTSIIKNLNILPLSFEIETLKILQVADSSSSGRETQRLCLWSLRGMQISFDHDHKYSPLFIPYCWLLYDYQHNTYTRKRELSKLTREKEIRKELQNMFQSTNVKLFTAILFVDISFSFIRVLHIIFSFGTHLNCLFLNLKNLNLTLP